VVQTRVVAHHDHARRQAIGLSRIDTIVSLLLALLINGAILVLAAAAFHQPGNAACWTSTTPTAAGTGGRHGARGHPVRPGAAGVGPESTFTGTIAGQVIMEGFLNMKIPCWQRRALTRGLALVPAMIGVLVLGEHAVGKLLVLSQVVLSMQLPFAMYPLVSLTCAPHHGQFANAWWTTALAWFLLP
jgi:manganese transport protein